MASAELLFDAMTQEPEYLEWCINQIAFSVNKPSSLSKGERSFYRKLFQVMLGKLTDKELADFRVLFIDRGISLLALACAFRLPDEVDKLLINQSIDVNREVSNFETPISLAIDPVTDDSLKILNALIEHGADINIAIKRRGKPFNLLQMAIIKSKHPDSLAILRIFLRKNPSAFSDEIIGRYLADYSTSDAYLIADAATKKLYAAKIMLIIELGE